MEKKKVSVFKCMIYTFKMLYQGDKRIAIFSFYKQITEMIVESLLGVYLLRTLFVVFISHRLSTTKEADRIYLFENGVIAEQGTHSELMARNGIYADMFSRQAHYYQQNV